MNEEDCVMAKHKFVTDYAEYLIDLWKNSLVKDEAKEIAITRINSIINTYNEGRMVINEAMGLLSTLYDYVYNQMKD